MRYDDTVQQVLSGAASLPQSATGETSGWASPSEVALARLRATLQHAEPARYLEEVQTVPTVQEAARQYLLLRQRDLRPGGFKSVRYSVELFASKYGDLTLPELGRDEGREFLSLIAQLSPYLGKSKKTRGLSLDASMAWSRSANSRRITGRTQRRIWSQVKHWLDWCVYEGELETNPFASVRFEAKVRHHPYAVPTDNEVRALLGQEDPHIGHVLLCLPAVRDAIGGGCWAAAGRTSWPRATSGGSSMSGPTRCGC